MNQPAKTLAHILHAADAAIVDEASARVGISLHPDLCEKHGAMVCDECAPTDRQYVEAGGPMGPPPCHSTMLTSFRHPKGVLSVSNEDAGCGELLVVRMKNGWTVVIDAQHLWNHECQAHLYRPGTWDGDDAGEGNVAGMAFDNELPTEITLTNGM